MENLKNDGVILTEFLPAFRKNLSFSVNKGNVDLEID